MQKIAGFLKNRRMFWFLIILIIIFLGYFLIFKENKNTSPKEGSPIGFSNYIIKDDHNVFKVLFPIYEHNPNSDNSSLYSYYKVMKEGLIDGRFNVLINQAETDNYNIESHQTMKIFDYNAFDKPKFAMYAIYISYPKEPLREVTEEDLITYAKNQATSSGVEISNYEIIKYKNTIAVEYEYPLQLDKNIMISKHLAFMKNGFVVNLSIVRTQFLTEKDVHFEQFINSFESTDLATGSLLLGN